MAINFQVFRIKTNGRHDKILLTETFLLRFSLCFVSFSFYFHYYLLLCTFHSLLSVGVIFFCNAGAQFYCNIFLLCPEFLVWSVAVARGATVIVFIDKRNKIFDSNIFK